VTSTTSGATRQPDSASGLFSQVEDQRPERRSTETKASTKTTEFFVYLAAVAAVIVTALVVGKDGAGSDPFNALDAIRYISYLTIGYMIARGLAKSGSREAYTASKH
jgi:hypothetical protein